MRITIEIPRALVDRVPGALTEIRREGTQRRAVYPRWIEAGKLSAATARRRIKSLIDAYRVVDAVATAIAPLLLEQPDPATVKCPDSNRGVSEGGVAIRRDPAQDMARGGSAGGVSAHPPTTSHQPSTTNQQQEQP